VRSGVTRPGAESVVTAGRARGLRPEALLARAAIVVGALAGGAALALALGGSEDRVAVPKRVDVPVAQLQLDPVAREPRRPRAEHRDRRRRVGRPVRIAVPSAGISARVVPVGLTRDRALQVPSDAHVTGWWKGGPRPGQPGPAVIVGHVDTVSGPAVFYPLRVVRRGDLVVVRRADGGATRFTVQRVVRYRKARFPTAAVYGLTRSPTLRLITCSGSFDRSTGHYLDNTVVYATALTDAPR
jgi:sortase family protein